MHELVTVQSLLKKVAAIFIAAGFGKLHAEAMARTVVAGERDGCKSHGVFRIEGCLRTLKAGKVNPTALPRLVTDETAIVRVEAGGAMSSLAFETGLPALAERARTHGIAALAINDCVHFTALWPEVEALAEMGLAGLAMCPSYATVAPAGGTAPLLGTNPLAFGWPRPGAHPYVFDFATSVAARGEIELHRRAGRPLPPHWAIDVEGQPTTDPQAALAGAMLPFGGHKGSAISTMIELLAGVMIGDLTSAGALEKLGTTALAPEHGELVLAFSLERFGAGRLSNTLDRAEVLFSAITAQGARLPSSRRYDARQVSLRDGIVLSEVELSMLNEQLERGLESVRA